MSPSFPKHKAHDLNTANYLPHLNHIHGKMHIKITMLKYLRLHLTFYYEKIRILMQD